MGNAGPQKDLAEGPDAAAPASGGVDPAEVAKFEAIAAEWWDPAGKFAPLHAMNPCRMGYAAEQIALARGRDARRLRALAGLSAVDVGCGGGLASEALARLGARVTGIDAAGAAIPVARLHAQAAGLTIDYRQGEAADLTAEGRHYDAVLALEVIEHVPDPTGFVRTLAGLAAPGGAVILSTLNRTPQAWATAILGAERILGWLPRGTHDWNRFLTPDELSEMLTAAGLSVIDTRGMVFDPLNRRWRLSEQDLSINYLITAQAPA
ncbi:MAG: bifunctional 2-polyprenyl-6-hydroxyphenol methylase/3-demethylubiquinol 3-O-methyltransferase UbiG [Pseudomonadota bacterium]